MNIQGAYTYSWFANLAYINWRPESVGLDKNQAISTDRSIEDANDSNRAPGKIGGSVDTLGEKIFNSVAEGGEGWRVADFHPDDPTGFSASVFVNATTGEKVLGIRGTDPKNNFVEDLLRADVAEIGGLGMAISQAVSLFNYVQELQGAKDASVTHLTLRIENTPPPEGVMFQKSSKNITGPMGGVIHTYYWFEADNSGIGKGLISQDESVTITGHSLGGHLATIGARLFPELFDQAATYNAPGFDPISSHGWTEGFINMFSEHGISPAGSFNDLVTAEKLFTFEGESVEPGDDFEFVASILTGAQVYGEEQFIATEFNSHLIEPMMDSLAIQSLLEQLNPEIGFSGATKLMASATNIANKTDETIVNALSKLILNSSGSLEIIDITEGVDAYFANSGDFNKRAALHTRIIELEQTIKDQSLQLIDVNTLSNSANLNNADGFAYRYALVNLNPFAITGDVNLYTQHNNSGELNIDKFTDQYLQDRADFLGFKNEAYRKDGSIYLGEVSSDPTLYHDLQSGFKANLVRKNTTIGSPIPEVRRIKFGSELAEVSGELDGDVKNDHLYGGGGLDLINGGAGDDHIEGNIGDDILYGDEGQDTLIGGKGDDHLHGGADADTLIGGKDNDTYYYNDGDGNDTIIDSDGEGSIEWKGQTLTAVSLNESNSHIDDDKGIRYLFEPDTAGGTVGTLKLYDINNPSESSITITGYTLGQLGLTNGVTEPDKPDVISTTILGGSERNDSLALIQDYYRLEYFKQNGHHNFAAADALFFNLLEQDNTWLGHAGNDAFSGYGGDDVLIGGEGNDWLWGDRTHPGVGENGNDWLEGGIGNDYLFTGRGDDFAYGGEGDDLILANESFAPGLQISEGSSPPSVVQVAAEDLWYSKAVITPQETLGNRDGQLTFLYSYDYVGIPEGTVDVVFTGYTSAHSYSYTYSPGGGEYGLGQINVVNSGNNHTGSYDLKITHYVDSEPDYGMKSLYGGEGNDTIVGNAGNDWLSGGVGDDKLAGNDGNDVLSGGDGKDILLAGKGDDVLEGGKQVDNLYGEQGNDRLFGGSGDDYLWGDSDYLDISVHGDDYLDGGDGDDQLVGGDGADTLIGGQGIDTLFGDQGADTLEGGSEVDYLRGGDGDDTLHGGTGNDYLYGQDDDDILYGGKGSDTLFGGEGNDTLYGGTGVNDVLIGGSGNDTYLFYAGDGNTSVNNASTGQDILRFVDIASTGVSVKRNGDKLLITVIATSEVITVQPYFNRADTLELIEFSDNESWDLNQVKELVLKGSGADDIIDGYDDSDDVIYALGGNDIVDGKGGNDTLDGGDGTDTVIGGDGDDVLSGGRGAGDVLEGNAGNDVYLFSIGDGDTTINNYDENFNSQDMLRFGEGILPADVELTILNNDLVITIKGTGEVIRV